MNQWIVCHENSEDIAAEDTQPSDPLICRPELMTRHQLMKCLQRRHLSLTEEALNGYEYYNCISMYNKVLLPFPQRLYGNNRKSRRLQTNQNDCNKRSDNKRKFEELDKNDNKLITNDNNLPKNETKVKQISNSVNDSKRSKISWP